MRQARPPKEIPPPLELECLKALWDLGEGSVHAVRQQIEARRKLAYTTVMTLLDRLSKKGAVARRKNGRAFLYTAQVDRETMRKKAIVELTESLFDSSPDLLRKYVQDGPAPASKIVEPQEARLDTSLL